MREETRRWLEWEETLSKGEADQRTAELEAEGKKPPEQPQPLAELRRLRRFNFSHMPYPGGMHNQPHIWVQEIHAAIDGEMEYKQMVAANKRLRDMVAKQR